MTRTGVARAPWNLVLGAGLVWASMLLAVPAAFAQIAVVREVQGLRQALEATRGLQGAAALGALRATPQGALALDEASTLLHAGLLGPESTTALAEAGLLQTVQALAPSETQTTALSRMLRNEPLIFTGVPQVASDGIKLVTDSHGELFLAVNPGANWSNQWAAETAAFEGHRVTVKAWPDETGTSLVVEQFAPGSSDRFVMGRVEPLPDGVGIRVAPDKWVRIDDDTLSETLAPFARTGVILQGRTVPYLDDGELRWRFVPDGPSLYVLTRLNPTYGNYILGDTPFQKTRIEPSNDAVNEAAQQRWGDRVIVHGTIQPGVEGFPRVLSTDWVSQRIPTETQDAVKGRGKDITLITDQNRARAVAPFAAVPGTCAGRCDFDPVKSLVEHVSGIQPAVRRVSLQGPLLAEGSGTPFLPDHEGTPHGAWRLTLDGRPAFEWVYRNGRLVEAGYLDKNGLRHGDWIGVHPNGTHDMLQAGWKHGQPTGTWYYFHPRPEGAGSIFDRLELYEDGRLTAAGPVHALRINSKDVILRHGTWRAFDAQSNVLTEEDFDWRVSPVNAETGEPIDPSTLTP